MHTFAGAPPLTERHSRLECDNSAIKRHGMIYLPIHFLNMDIIRRVKMAEFVDLVKE